MENIILDTDIGNDIDDVIALFMLNNLHSKGFINFQSVLSSNGHVDSSKFVDFINSYFGNKIPVGKIFKGVKDQRKKYLHLLPLLKELFPSVKSEIHFKNNTEVFLDNIKKAPDNSITLLMIGFSTNIARILRNEKYKSLAEKKVKKIVCMAGHFPSGAKEYNVFSDPESFSTLIDLWEKEIVFVGFELGKKIIFPVSEVKRLESLNNCYPLTLAYRAYKKHEYDRPSWDLITALYACYPDNHYFHLSSKGRVLLERDLGTKFDEDSSRNHRYLKISSADHDLLLGDIIKCLE